MVSAIEVEDNQGSIHFTHAEENAHDDMENRITKIAYVPCRPHKLTNMQANRILQKKCIIICFS